MPENTGFISCNGIYFTDEKEPDFNRKHTRDSVFLIHKWIYEGMSLKLIGSILNRTEENVLIALRYPLNENELYILRKYFSPFNERENNFSK